MLSVCWAMSSRLCYRLCTTDQRSVSYVSIHRFKNQDVDMGIAVYTMDLNFLLAKLIFCIFTVFFSDDLEVMFLKGRMISPRDSSWIPLNQKLSNLCSFCY